MAKKKGFVLPIILKGAAFLLASFVLGLSALEIFSISWGSGSFLGRISEKWIIALAGVYGIYAGLLYLVFVTLFWPQTFKSIVKQLIDWRGRLGFANWVLLAAVLLLPAWFIFYSSWGGLITGVFTRLVIFMICLIISAALLCKDKKAILEWEEVLLASLLIGVALTLAESLVLVNDFPFALHWSEGNRLWDYSVVFARDTYNVPAGEAIYAHIDAGRQNLWGLPYLIQDVPIWVVRLWAALLVTLPYAILGWVAFRPAIGLRAEWLLAGMWAMLFLNQGPLYTPLVLAATLVALARRKPIWLALPLLFIAGDYAGSSRYSWRFAPAIWAAIITFGDAVLLYGRQRWQDWLRAAALALAGVWTKGLPLLVGVIVGLFPLLMTSDTAGNAIVMQPQGGVETLEGLQAITTHHPFLFERLFPNPIYPPGILLGLSLATLPLILLLINLARRGVWKTGVLQIAVTALGLGALLVVGVIASAKVGGGTDLHNMDMFLIGLVLVAGLAWEGFGPKLRKFIQSSVPIRLLLLALVVIPASTPMVEGKPLDIPEEERTDFVLERIQSFVACARQYGEVLFMDQRQLITFGHMGDLPLVDEYEKKFVMDKALEGNEIYFQQFQQDLASGRFSLIVTEREAILYKEADVHTIGDSLIEENNAWVRWVTTPLLQYYESVADYKDVAVEMFMPIGREFDCP